jgi:uncharacterized membrane protein
MRQPKGHGGRTPQNSSPGVVAQNVAAVAKLEAAEHARLTRPELFADAIARMAGTPSFAAIHVVWFAVWLLWNLGPVAALRPFDPYPFSFLTLVVSLEAIFLSIFVLVSQNALTRQSERRAHLDLQINLLAEQESTKTVALLQRIAEHLKVPLPTESTDASPVTPTDIRDVVSTLDRILPGDAPKPTREKPAKTHATTEETS